MKKVISRLIIILFLAALTFLGYYGYRGYVMYQDTMEEKSLPLLELIQCNQLGHVDKNAYPHFLLLVLDIYLIFAPI